MKTLKEIITFLKETSSYVYFFAFIFIMMLIIAAIAKLGLEIIRAIVGVLNEYWYITILLALIIIYFTGKAHGKK